MRQLLASIVVALVFVYSSAAFSAGQWQDATFGSGWYSSCAAVGAYGAAQQSGKSYSSCAQNGTRTATTPTGTYKTFFTITYTPSGTSGAYYFDCDPSMSWSDATHGCVAQQCGVNTGSDLGPVPMNATYNPDGSVDPMFASGAGACINNCTVMSTRELDMTVSLSSGKVGAGTASHVNYWTVQGVPGQKGASCTSTSVGVGQSINGTSCAVDKWGHSACVDPDAVPPQAGDAADVVKNGVDLGPSTTPLIPDPPGGCVTTSSGGTFCTTDFVNVPDIGVPGSPATPDATYTTSNGSCSGAGACTYNYYNSQTTGTSTNYGNGSPSNQCPAGVVKLPNGSCGSTGSCPTGQTKNSAGTCVGTGNGTGTGQTDTVSGTGFAGVKTFGESAADFSAGVANSPIGQALNGFTDGMPDGGTCTSASFELWGQTFTFDAFCTILQQAAPIIRTASLAAFAILAVVLFFMA